MSIRKPPDWPINRLQSEFTRRHISWTQPRNEIYLALARLGPCSATELATKLTGRINRATVFRTIKLFLAIGVVLRLGSGLIELAPPHRPRHHYLKCSNCGRRTGFNDDKLEAQVARLAASRNFIPGQSVLEISGQCQNCV
jgi:Fe2+ or Zn2+ uptake regulation protein